MCVYVNFFFDRFERKCESAQSDNCKTGLCAYMFMVVIYAVKNQYYSCKFT